MRIPFFIAALLAVLVIGGTWWIGTRKIDFVTPPSQEKLAEIAAATGGTVPQAAEAQNEISKPAEKVNDLPVPSTTPHEEPVATISLGDLSVPPTLDAYADRAADGAEKMLELASLLETSNQPQRALLAWERVLDSCAPSPEQAAAAVAAIKRLRPSTPPWNADADKRTAITFHAGTGQKVAKKLRPMLEQAARDLEAASSGLLKISTDIAVGPHSNRTAAAPVALWFTGAEKTTRSTEVLSFTFDAPEKLRSKIDHTAWSLLTVFLKRTGQPVTEQDDALAAIQSRITRLDWQKIGQLLNSSSQPSQKPVLVRPKIKR